jgi:hypothetical protein
MSGRQIKLLLTILPAAVFPLQSARADCATTVTVAVLDMSSLMDDWPPAGMIAPLTVNP